MSTARKDKAKFWPEPTIDLAQNFEMSVQQIRAVQTKVEAHADEIRAAWHRHFGS
jgi:hypothetical protein